MPANGAYDPGHADVFSCDRIRCSLPEPLLSRALRPIQPGGPPRAPDTRQRAGLICRVQRRMRRVRLLVPAMAMFGGASLHRRQKRADEQERAAITRLALK